MKPETMICAECRRVLNSKVFSDGSPTIFLHAFPGGEDHEPVPTPEREALVINVQCDFCVNTDHLNWTVWITNFFETLPDGGVFVHGEDWATCDTCAELIRSGQWNALTRRSVITAKQKHPELDPRALKAAIQTLHAQVRKRYLRIERSCA